VEPKPDMKDYMYLYRLVVFVISVAFFPRYASIYILSSVFHFSSFLWTHLY